MELEQLIQLIDAVSESKLTDFQYEESGVKLRLKKEAAPMPGQAQSADSVHAQTGGAAISGLFQTVPGTAQTAAGIIPNASVPGVMQSSAGATGVVQTAQSAEAAVVVQSSAGAADITTDGKIVKSPLVGVFYAAPSEDKEPYVSVGDTVKKGQILACVEAMKLMNEIESDYEGVVAEILVENGQGVGYGEPLFVIR